MRGLGVTLALAALLIGAADVTAAKRKPRPAADLQVRVSDSPGVVLVGQRLVYHVTVANRGPSAARRVVVTADVPVPVYAYDVSRPATSSCEMPKQAGRVVCRIQRLVARSSWTLELSGAAAAPATFTLSASVRSATPDPRRQNNRGAARTQVTVTDVCCPPPGTPRSPGASVVAAGIEVPLYLASICWGDLDRPVGGPCLDPIPPALESLPPVHVRPGNVLTFRFQLAPKGVDLAVYRPNGEVMLQTPLDTASSTTWRVPAGFSAPPPGLLAGLFAASPDVQATYYARLVT